MNTLSDWLAHLESLHPKGQGGIELGLARVELVKERLQQTPRCPLIIVGGTNGKGSTCAYLEAIYRAAGYRVGCYTSPHLLDYNERVRVGGAPVGDAALCAAFAKVEAARRAGGEVALTYFEFGTLAAWEVFAACAVEVLILEVGLGGRLDAVNAYEPDCAVVTGIALDHTDWLGATREAIGFEKAGIYRAGKPALCADPEPPASLVEHAQAIGADLRLIGRDFGAADEGGQWSFWARGAPGYLALPLPALPGAYQLRNASAALAVIEALAGKLPVPSPAIARGVRAAALRGRFERLPRAAGAPTIVLDVAHNPQAVAAFADNLAAMGAFGRTIAVVGMLADKDIAGSLSALAGRIDVWLLADLDVARGASARTLSGVIEAGRIGGRVECFASPTQAFARAASLAGEDDRIAVFGSFHTVAAVLRAVQDGA